MRAHASFALLLIACGSRTQAPTAVDAAGPRFVQLSPQGEANAQVRVVRLAPTTFTPMLRTVATISGDPKGIARLGSRVPGRVAKLDVVLGDRVKKGQALVELDSVETHQVTLDLATAKAKARATDDALARQRQLFAERVGAEQDLRRAEAEAAANRAALHEAEEHLQFLGLSPKDVQRAGEPGDHGERSILRAPIDGQVATLDVSLGQVLQGSEDIVTIVQLDKVWVDLRIYERDLARVARGRAVEVRVPAYPDRVFRGTLSFVGDLVDPITRTIPARAKVDGGAEGLRPGMTATAFVSLLAEPGTLWLPVGAVQRHEGESIAFVRVGEHRFEPRSIVVGVEEGGFVPVRSGLAAGAEIVVEGALALRGELERSALEE